jgi:hypothetical protein
VWRIRRDGALERFVEHPSLAPEPGSPVPGANGIAVAHGALLVANTRFGRIVRIPINADGSAGAPTTVLERADLIGADGLALDVRRNLYVAMFGGPTGARLVRISPEGRRQELAGEADGSPAPPASRSAPAETPARACSSPTSTCSRPPPTPRSRACRSASQADPFPEEER